MDGNLLKSNGRERPLILIDAMNVAIRYHYALRLSDKIGYPTGMLYGTLRLLKSLQKEYPRSHIIFLWEGCNSLRKAKQVDYKANRNRSDNYVLICSKELQTALSYLAVDQIYAVGLEADDLIGYYVNKHKGRKRILLLSNDSDMWQYFQDNVQIRNSKGLCSYKRLQTELGFPPERIWLYKALVGDRSDNISGLSRFPRKLATLLCKSYDSLDDACKASVNLDYKKWINMMQDSKGLLSRNVELIKFQPKWISTSKLISMSKFDLVDGMERLQKLLRKRNIKSL